MCIRDRLPPLVLRERRPRPGTPAGRPLPWRSRRSRAAAGRVRRGDGARRAAANGKWDDALVAELAATGAVDSVDFKGQYRGTTVDTPPDAALYGRVAEGL